MRELARIRAEAGKLPSAKGGGEDPTVTLLDDALRLLETMRSECAALQQRCTELESRLAARVDAAHRLHDAMPQPIITTDSTGVILDANRAACAALARSRPKLVNDLLLHFVEDRVAFSGVVRELARATAPIVARARFRPPDRAPFGATVTVLRDPRVDPAEWLWLLSRDPS
jgi:PAS domain-containing protein